jgi:peptide/nickel transport system ATP-binding protein
MSEAHPLLAVEHLTVTYRLRKKQLFAPAPVLRAVDDVSLVVPKGESFAVVGESGSGKSTLARAVLGLVRPNSGSVRLGGQDLHALNAQGLRLARRNLSMIFQDPYDSLDPRLTVGASVGDPLSGLGVVVSRAERQERVAEALAAVGLRISDATKYPHEFSGGQRQRVAIARAIITRPSLIVADEPVSALDVSVQAQVLNLLADLRDRFGVAYLFISHNLAVVKHVAERVAVMQSGRIVEHGAVSEVFSHPQHDYTRSLLASMLKPEARRRRSTANE